MSMMMMNTITTTTTASLKYYYYSLLLLATHVHVRYMLSPVRLSVVRLSSVTCVHPTQATKIFGNVSTPFGTLATCDL